MVTEEIFEASSGLADLLEYYDMNPSELAKGQIRNFVTNQVYVAKSNLTSNELLKVANAAKNVRNPALLIFFESIRFKPLAIPLTFER